MNDKNKISILLGIIGALVIVVVLKWLPTQSTPKIPKVIIVQDKPQEWADALKLGLHDGLREQGIEEGVGVVIISRSAAGDPSGLTGLAEVVAKQNAAVVYALGTQSSQAIFRAVKNKPIVFGAVTDPVKAGFYDDSLDKPKGNITGTQDLWPYSAQFDLILELVPNAKKVGIVYNSSEINSQVSVQYIRQECQKNSLELLDRTVTEESQIPAAVASLLDADISVFFIPADNTAQTSSRTIIAACSRKQVPVFSGISGIVENGALGCVGTNYYELGRVNATQIASILKGKKAREIPVKIADKGDLYLRHSNKT
jgi:putative ABC transport system substrate-binding protein